MTILNRTYELRNLYFLQSQDSAEEAKPDYSSLFQWADNAYFERFEPDAELLRRLLSPEKKCAYSIADQVFGSQKEQQYIGLRHLSNLFLERCRLYKQHLRDIDHRHMEIQEKLFGVKINNFPDRAKRLSNLEGQLLQLESQRRDEEIAFWKDTVELRAKLFENTAAYKDARQRFSILSDVEGKYVG